MDDFGAGLTLGIVLGAAAMITAVHNMDTSADKMFKAIEICEPLGGLKYYDQGGDYTCGNGLVIDLDSYKEKADAARSQ